MSVSVSEHPERVLASAHPKDRTGPAIATVLRLLIAACSLAAGAIHFGFASAHFSEYWAYGLFFTVIAWAQLLFALGLVAWRWRRMLWVSAAVNTAVIGVYVLSRTVGVWVGPNATVKEAVSLPDLLATGFESAIVVGTVLLLTRPRLGTWRLRRSWLLWSATAAASVSIAASTGYSLTPRFAAAHNHAALSGNTPCEKTGPPASEGQVLDSAGHFHRGPAAQLPVDEPTRLTLQAQQEQARLVASRYPTVADAEAAGYRQSTVYVPCIGAHYTNVALVIGFNPSTPSELLFDGTAPTARIVGLSYLILHSGGAPAGFAGPNDVWHQHTFNGGLCMRQDGLVVGAESTTPAQCAALNGTKVPLTDVWMLHDWVVPGFECSWGVFASECPELGGRLGGTAWDAPK